MTDDRVSVVVVTRNRRTELLQTLARLVALPERPEVIVVDNASTDGSAAAVEASGLPGVRAVALARNAGAAGRSIGVAHASGRHVAFCDDDSWWEPGALRTAADLLDAHPRIGLVAGRILLEPGGRLEPACAAMAASPLPSLDGDVGRRVLGFVACGAVVRRSAYLRAGGFAARAGIGGEERLLACDLAAKGWECVYAEHVVAHHAPSPARDRGRRRAVVVRNDAWFAWSRLPLRDAVRATAMTAAAALADPAARRGLAEALRGAPAALRDRRPVPPVLAAELRSLATP